MARVYLYKNYLSEKLELHRSFVIILYKLEAVLKDSLLSSDGGIGVVTILKTLELPLLHLGKTIEDSRKPYMAVVS